MNRENIYMRLTLCLYVLFVMVMIYSVFFEGGKEVFALVGMDQHWTYSQSCRIWNTKMEGLNLSHVA